MLFQTWEFVIFFAIVMAGMALLRPGLKSLWLLAASYFFYGYMSPAFLVFIIYITIVDYFISGYIEHYQWGDAPEPIQICRLYYRKFTGAVRLYPLAGSRSNHRRERTEYF